MQYQDSKAAYTWSVNWEPPNPKIIYETIRLGNTKTCPAENITIEDKYTVLDIRNNGHSSYFLIHRQDNNTKLLNRIYASDVSISSNNEFLIIGTHYCPMYEAISLAEKLKRLYVNYTWTAYKND